MNSEKPMTPAEFYKKLSKEDKKAIANASNTKPFDFISTGSWVINTLIGDGTLTGNAGGLPRGHFVEVFGDESSGKTTLGVSACVKVQEKGGLPVYVDFERSFHQVYAEKLGLDTNPEKFILMTPDNLQHGVGLIQQALKMRPWLIVVDSVSAMIPKEFMEGSIDEAGQIGLQARFMSIMLPYIKPSIVESNTCILFLNQLRSVIKKSQYDAGPNEETSGGKALKFYASIRIKLKKTKTEEVSTTSRITGKIEKKPVNVIVKTTVIKNRIDKPMLSGPVYIRFGEGFDNILSIIELAINTQVIKKSGAFLKFDVAGKTLFNIQGTEQLRNFLDEAENAGILNKLKECLVPKEDEEAKVQYEKEQEEEPETKEELDLLLNQASETFLKDKKPSE
jgi:recombination protein RecA